MEASSFKITGKGKRMTEMFFLTEELNGLCIDSRSVSQGRIRGIKLDASSSITAVEVLCNQLTQTTRKMEREDTFLFSRRREMVEIEEEIHAHCVVTSAFPLHVQERQQMVPVLPIAVKAKKNKAHGISYSN